MPADCEPECWDNEFERYLRTVVHRIAVQSAATRRIAIRLIEAILIECPNSTYWRMVRSYKLARDDPQESLMEARRALDLAETPYTLLCVGEALARIGMDGQALDHFRRAQKRAVILDREGKLDDDALLDQLDSYINYHTRDSDDTPASEDGSGDC